MTILSINILFYLIASIEKKGIWKKSKNSDAVQIKNKTAYWSELMSIKKYAVTGINKQVNIGLKYLVHVCIEAHNDLVQRYGQQTIEPSLCLESILWKRIAIQTQTHFVTLSILYQCQVLYFNTSQASYIQKKTLPNSS